MVCQRNSVIADGVIMEFETDARFFEGHGHLQRMHGIDYLIVIQGEQESGGIRGIHVRQDFEVFFSSLADS